MMSTITDFCTSDPGYIILASTVFQIQTSSTVLENIISHHLLFYWANSPFGVYMDQSASQGSDFVSNWVLEINPTTSAVRHGSRSLQLTVFSFLKSASMLKKTDGKEVILLTSGVGLCVVAIRSISYILLKSFCS